MSSGEEEKILESLISMITVGDRVRIMMYKLVRSYCIIEKVNETHCFTVNGSDLKKSARGGIASRGFAIDSKDGGLIYWF